MTKRQEDKDFIMKPKVDFCFKELMGDSQVRRGFISAFLGIRPEEIKETQLMTTHLPKEHLSDKLGILDVCVMLNGMTQIDMEIQVASFPLWPERSLFYLSKLFAGRISEGDSYAALCKCIHIGILDFVLFPQEEEYYSCYHFWEDRRRQMYTDKMEIHVLELPKLAQKNYPESDLLDWARFLGADCREEMERMAEKNEYLGKAYERLNHISADEDKRMEYLAREKAIRDYNYLMGENLRQGLEQGLEQGLVQGIAKGENLKLISQIRKKYLKGISVETCAEMLEENPDMVRQLYRILEVHPDWEDVRIGKVLSGELENEGT